MFDWNDEEFANIILGEGGEREDHTVPYADGSEENPPNLYADHVKKEWNQDTTNVRAADEKNSAAKSDMQVGKLENSSQYDEIKGLPATGFGMDSWPDMSLSNAANTDQDSMDTGASNSHTEISKRDFSIDETAQLGIGSEIFQGCEDRDRGDFVEYDWANIGSFDDLDRIFSNDDPIFGHNSIDNTNELWSSSKDPTSSPEKTIPLSLGSPSFGLGGLKSSSAQLQVKAEYPLDEGQPFASDYDKINDLASNSPQNSQASIDHIDFAGGKSKLLSKDKISLEMIGKTKAFNSQLAAETVVKPHNPARKGPRQKRLFKDLNKSEEKMDDRQMQGFGGIWSLSVNQFQQFEDQYTVAMGHSCPSPLVSQQKQIHGAVPSPYNQCPPPLLATMYENMANQYPAMTALPQFHSGEDALMKPQIMTPQEKMEKLRRRQQMRAMLAIQKQHQQFTQQGSCAETSDGKRISHENRTLLMTGGNAEVEDNLSFLPAFDANSPREKDDSNTVSTAFDDCSVESTILYQLQEIIDKMDIRIRLRVRDSLFRLAHSSIKRQYASDTSNTNRSNREEVLTKEAINSHSRFSRMPDSETETNPMDRTVAHLLFHGPPHLPGKLPETTDSAASSKLPFQRNTASSISLSMVKMPESCENEQILSKPESKAAFLFSNVSQSENRLPVDASEKASNNEDPQWRYVE